MVAVMTWASLDVGSPRLLASAPLTWAASDCELDALVCMANSACSVCGPNWAELVPDVVPEPAEPALLPAAVAVAPGGGLAPTGGGFMRPGWGGGAAVAVAPGGGLAPTGGGLVRPGWAGAVEVDGGGSGGDMGGIAG
jgi:hypothetical protein